jgi:hypothetical protein
MAKEITDALERLDIKINIGYNLPPLPTPGDTPNPPGSSDNTGVGGGEDRGNPTPEAAGDWLHVTQPRTFTVGEAGPEDVIFGGAGRDLARDVAAALGPMIGSAGGGGNFKVHVYLDGRDVTANVVTRVAQDKQGAGTKLKRGLGLPV